MQVYDTPATKHWLKNIVCEVAEYCESFHFIAYRAKM